VKPEWMSKDWAIALVLLALCASCTATAWLWGWFLKLLLEPGP